MINIIQIEEYFLGILIYGCTKIYLKIGITIMGMLIRYCLRISLTNYIESMERIKPGTIMMRLKSWNGLAKKLQWTSLKA